MSHFACVGLFNGDQLNAFYQRTNICISLFIESFALHGLSVNFSKGRSTGQLLAAAALDIAAGTDARAAMDKRRTTVWDKKKKRYITRTVAETRKIAEEKKKNNRKRAGRGARQETGALYRKWRQERDRRGGGSGADISGGMASDDPSLGLIAGKSGHFQANSSNFF